MTSLPKWALGAIAFIGLSLGLAAPAQAYHGHRGGGLSISFGDPYSGAYVSVPIGHRYHHRRHNGYYPYSHHRGYRPSGHYSGYRPYGYYAGHKYRPYAYYPPRYRYRYRHAYRPYPYYGHRYGWRDHGWRHHRHPRWH